MSEAPGLNGATRRQHMDEDEASVDQLPQWDLPGRPCSVAAALSVVGEKWALLAIREITFGNRRFDQIARNTGAPRDRLAARLRALEAAGVVERRQYSDHPPRYEYALTQAGDDLRFVLTALRTWGDKWAVAAPPLTFTHSCGHDLDPVMTCRHCGAEVRPGELSQRSLVAGWDKAGPASYPLRATKP
ncbi:MAG TPA: helix-turn-helix domain-containing protein [Trebonia sp.]|nr:helix-turn-helix domain-containing protein [Trebonia sp.]